MSIHRWYYFKPEIAAMVAAPVRLAVAKKPPERRLRARLPAPQESPQECGDRSLRGCATEAVVNFSVHILLVDDDSELCSLLGEFLRREGFTVECEHEGYRGLEKARGAGVDLVVLDVMLPGIDGFEILRRPGPAGKVPGMMLTGP